MGRIEPGSHHPTSLNVGSYYSGQISPRHERSHSQLGPLPPRHGRGSSLTGGNTKSLQQFASNGRNAESALALGGPTASQGKAEPVDDHKHVVEFAASRRGHYEMVK